MTAATKLLVANRGEIARRIFRTARRMGIATVAVFSDADADAPFVREADEAVRIGPAPARESYLAIDRIVAAARATGAELVHPGYGFLAEEPAFARAVTEAGLHFVGPSAEVLAVVGSKAEAKGIARRAGVPVLPGYAEEDQRDQAFASAARTIGYPVIVKPTAGGGGIGMLVAEAPGKLRDALARARRAALAAFGDERLMLERYVPAPRHVEVQILADQHQRIRTLGERDCSAQRRHQKILEESPAPQLTRWQREALAQAAQAMARATGYIGAGTVEFVVDEKGKFSFLEVNARLQVEHTVTEELYGLDIVEQQIRIALGERLLLGRLTARGHAIEARVYAEDARAGFLPSAGRLVHVRWPEDVRVDAGYEEGSAVTAHYDPLLAKIIAHGADRAAALDSLAAALRRTEVLGVRSNVPFLMRLVDHPDVRAGKVTTDLVGREIGELTPEAGVPEEAWALAGAAVVHATAADRRDPWNALGAWRVGLGQAGTVVLRDGDQERPLTVEGGGPYLVGTVAVAKEHAERHAWTVGGEPAAAALDGPSAWVAWRGETFELRTDAAERRIEELVAAEIDAPMPGVVLSVHAESGQRVRRGDLVAILEAMKMELRVEAPAAGTVTRVLCAVGDQVKRGQRLAEFAPSS